jgi:hypothetical protein
MADADVITPHDQDIWFFCYNFMLLFHVNFILISANSIYPVSPPIFFLLVMIMRGVTHEMLIYKI